MGTTHILFLVKNQGVTSIISAKSAKIPKKTSPRMIWYSALIRIIILKKNLKYLFQDGTLLRSIGHDFLCMKSPRMSYMKQFFINFSSFIIFII